LSIDHEEDEETMRDGHISAPDYTLPVFKDLTKTTRDMARLIRQSGVKFDAIAGCGFSGLLLTGSLAALLSKHTIAVRKNPERTFRYEDMMAQGAVGAARYIIVDDLISSGRTVCHMIHEIENEARKQGFAQPKLVAVYLYYSRGDGSPETDWFAREDGTEVVVPVYRRPR
jgi:orotate phosphoribosyltransferase